jgi:hypothetical protein
MLQSFVQNVSSIFTYVAIIFYLDTTYVFTHMLQQYFQMFQLFQSYVAGSVFFMLQLFYLDIAYVFTHILQAYVRNISSISNVYCIRVFHITSADRRR